MTDESPLCPGTAAALRPLPAAAAAATNCPVLTSAGQPEPAPGAA